MHTFDIIILIIISIFVIIGIKRGFIVEVFRLFAMIGGFVIAFIYYKDISHFIPLSKIPLQVLNGIAFVLLYIATAVGLLCIGWGLKKLIHFSLLGWIDRLLGACVGICKALLIAWVACLSISSFPLKRIQHDFGKSFIYRYYKHLPSSFELDGITKVRDTLRKIAASEKQKHTPAKP